MPAVCQILPKGVVGVLGPSSSPASSSIISNICGEKEVSGNVPCWSKSMPLRRRTWPQCPAAAQGWEGNTGALAPSSPLVRGRPGVRMELPTVGKGHRRDPDPFPSSAFCTLSFKPKMLSVSPNHSSASRWLLPGARAPWEHSVLLVI